MGFIVIKPDRRRSRIRTRCCPGTKRVLGQSRLALRCHAQTNQERERERERETSRRVPNKFNIKKIEKSDTYEHVTCDIQQ